MSDITHITINNIQVPIEEFSQRKLGELPNGGLSGTPLAKLYGEVLLAIYKQNICQFNDPKYDELLNFLASNSVTDRSWIPESYR